MMKPTVLKQLCHELGIGKPTEVQKLQEVKGKYDRYDILTEYGKYEIRHLNPKIMKEEERKKIENTEKIAAALKYHIPLKMAECTKGEPILEIRGMHFLVYKSYDAEILSKSEITDYHCGQVGRMLGRMHAADVKVEGIKKTQKIRGSFYWDRLLKTAEKKREECFILLHENEKNLHLWNHNILEGEKQISWQKVITHRNMRPETVIWCESQPFLTEWENAGYQNPFQEFVQVQNYWSTDEMGRYKKKYFEAVLSAYAESMSLCNVNWHSVLWSALDPLLGMLYESAWRALGSRVKSRQEQQYGMMQTIKYLIRIKKYVEQLDEFEARMNVAAKRKWAMTFSMHQKPF